jgi:hypothetical protein
MLNFLVFIKVKICSLIIFWCFDNAVLHEVATIEITVEYIYILLRQFFQTSNN